MSYKDWVVYKTAGSLDFGMFGAVDGAGTSSITLNSPYRYASSGNAYSLSFQISDSGLMTDLYVYLQSYTGTWGSTDGKINYDVRKGLASNFVPGTGCVGSGSITLDGSTTGWIRTSGLSIPLDKNTLYFITIGDYDGNASNYVTMVHGIGSINQQAYGTFSTTNGFTTGSSVGSVASPIAIQVTGKWYLGGMYETYGTIASTTGAIGNKFQVPEDCLCIGVFTSIDSPYAATGNVIKIFDGATNPYGTPMKSIRCKVYDVGGTTVGQVFMFADEDCVQMAATGIYRVTIEIAAGSTIPRKRTALGVLDTNLLRLRAINGSMHWCEASGANSWADNPQACSLMVPILVPYTIQPNELASGVWSYSDRRLT